MVEQSQFAKKTPGVVLRDGPAPEQFRAIKRHWDHARNCNDGIDAWTLSGEKRTFEGEQPLVEAFFASDPLPQGAYGVPRQVELVIFWGHDAQGKRVITEICPIPKPPPPIPPEMVEKFRNDPYIQSHQGVAMNPNLDNDAKPPTETNSSDGKHPAASPNTPARQTPAWTPAQMDRFMAVCKTQFKRLDEKIDDAEMARHLRALFGVSSRQAIDMAVNEAIRRVKDFVDAELAKVDRAYPAYPKAAEPEQGSGVASSTDGETAAANAASSASPSETSERADPGPTVPQVVVAAAPEIPPPAPQEILAASSLSFTGRALLPTEQEWRTMTEVATTGYKSGLLRIDNLEAAKFLVETGRELGIPPSLALRKLHMLGGQISMAAELMWAMVLNSGKLADFSIVEEADRCTVTVRRLGATQPYSTTFSVEMAQRIMTRAEGRLVPLAEKTNWRQMPGVMCRWRAISAACRVIFPDITLGVYSKEEMEDAIEFGETARPSRNAASEPAAGRA